MGLRSACLCLSTSAFQACTTDSEALAQVAAQTALESTVVKKRGFVPDTN